MRPHLTTNTAQDPPPTLIIAVAFATPLSTSISPTHHTHTVGTSFALRNSAPEEEAEAEVAVLLPREALELPPPSCCSEPARADTPAGVELADPWDRR